MIGFVFKVSSQFPTTWNVNSKREKVENTITMHALNVDVAIKIIIQNIGGLEQVRVK